MEILNEQFMASRREDSSVTIWDLYSFSIKYTHTQHKKWISCVKRLSSNLMASGDESGLIII